MQVLRVFKAGVYLWWQNITMLSVVCAIFLVVSFILRITISLFFVDALSAAYKVSNGIVNIIEFLVSSYVNIMLMLIVSKNGVDKGVIENIKEARGYFFPWLGADILFALLLIGITVAGLVLAFFAGLLCAKLNAVLGIITAILIGGVTIAALVHFLVRLSLYGYSCVLENMGSIAALKQSYALVKKHEDASIELSFVFGACCLLVFIPSLLAIAFMRESGLVRGVFIQANRYFFTLVFMPLGTSVFLVFYNNLKEAVNGVVAKTA